MANRTPRIGPVLVRGGTGKTGRRVAERLRQVGYAVRIGSRGGAPRFDRDDRTSRGPALRGATAACVAFQPDLAVPGAAATVGAPSDYVSRTAATGIWSPRHA